MRRRPSGSAEEDNIDASQEPTSQLPLLSDHAKEKRLSAHFDPQTRPGSLDRRRIDRKQLTPDVWDPPPQTLSGASGKAPSKMHKRSRWRRLRHRSPWSCSTPIVVATIVASMILLSIIHAFATRQLDCKGCQMCWSSPRFYQFKDFDTEHTRFASKYSLHLHREEGYDVDPRVRRVCNASGTCKLTIG